MATTREIIESYAREFPGLVFQNNGYEEMPAADKERLRPQIEELEALLKQRVWGFVRFQNLKRREKDGELAVRCQVYYNDERSFVGVSYIELREFDALEQEEA